MKLLTRLFFHFFIVCCGIANAQGIVKIGLNYPETGPYSVQGLDQFRAANMAVEEINAQGGILGQKVQLVFRDSKSSVETTRLNVQNLINEEKVKMVFGGSASSVALEASRICQQNKVLFFGTLTYSVEITGVQAHRHVFRECYNSWMGAKVLARYLKKNFPPDKNRYLYVTADYNWGYTTEASVRLFTGTGDRQRHMGIKTPFPDAKESDFRKVINFAKLVKPQVLVLVLFGKDMSAAIRWATTIGLKKKMQIVVPNLTLGMAEGSGPKVMEGVIGSLSWSWNVPYKYNFSKGIEFVEKFAEKYKRYPSSSGASSYTILHEYKAAVERGNSFDSCKVIKELEGRRYQLLKGKQYWRSFDHQSIQDVYAVRSRSEAKVLNDKFKMDYFEIIDQLPGADAAHSRAEWNALRIFSEKSTKLEKMTCP